MRSLFYCDTPYQLMTILNIMSSEKIREADLVVYHNFNGSADLIHRVKERHIFQTVYEVEAHNQSNIIEAKEMAFARGYLRKIGFGFNHYGCFFAACLDTVVSLNLYSVANYDKFILIDDGIGSYYSNILGGDYMSWKRLLILKMFHPIKKYFSVDSLFVYSPELCESRASKAKHKISLEFTDDMDYVFEYKPNSMYRGKTVILEQPCSFKELSSVRFELDKTFNRILVDNRLFEKTIIRLHPRMKKSDIGSCYDTTKNQWELECKNQIDDSNTLIAIHSTAIFQPTIMFGKYPRIILLYELYRNALSMDEYNRIKTFTRKFSHIYSKANILVPESFDKLTKILG